MRLSDDKARRLTRLVWRERLMRALPLVAIAVVLLGGVAYFTEVSVDRIDRTVGVQVHAGTVTGIKPGNAARGHIVLVHLGDGRDVEAFLASRLSPQAGSHVVINEARHVSGRSTYDIVRLGD